LTVSQQQVDYWEGNVSNTKFNNIYNIPSLRISIPKSEYQKIYNRFKLGETQKNKSSDTPTEENVYAKSECVIYKNFA